MACLPGLYGAAEGLANRHLAIRIDTGNKVALARNFCIHLSLLLQANFPFELRQTAAVSEEAILAPASTPPHMLQTYRGNKRVPR